MHACINHRFRDGEFICSNCGAPICRHCMFTYTSDEGKQVTLCSQCAQRQYLDPLTEAIEVYQRLRKELLFMAIGFLFGLLCMASSPLGLLTPFIFASLITIAKRIYTIALKSGFIDDVKESIKQQSSYGLFGQFLGLLLFIAVVLLLSPIIFIYRIVIRFIDIRHIKNIIQTIHGNVADIQTLIDNARMESISEMSNVSALEGTGDDEAFNFVASGLAKFNASKTGEIIRKIDRR